MNPVHMKSSPVAMFCILVTVFAGCKKENCLKGFIRIEYGTSFGECIGYCKRDISITADKILFTKSGWTDEEKDVHCSQDISADNFIGLAQKIDLPDFNRLDEIIGCPDCADGGAEWIRVVTVDSDKKVTFEYGNEPEEVKAFISALRDYLTGFADCQ